MNTKLVSHLIPSLLLVAAVSAHGEAKKTVVIEHSVKHQSSANEDGDGPRKVELAPVTYLGVVTAPVGRALASQLGLPDDVGLVVMQVSPDSPAAAVLKEHDVLTKFGDQILIDQRQLSVLVRSKKEGDEVALTVFRGGKETTVKAKLGKHDLPKLAEHGFEFGPGQGFRFLGGDGNGPDTMALRGMPGMGPDDVNDVMRLIGRERAHWFAGPRVHVMKREGDDGSTILDLAQGNFVFSDDDGSVEVNADDGKRELTVKNKKGDVTFKGPINNEGERQKLPPEVVARLNQIEKIDMGSQPGADFEQEGAAVPPPPQKTKISSPGRPAPILPQGSRPF